MKKTIQVSRHSTSSFEREVARLNKRATKVGVSPITFVRLEDLQVAKHVQIRDEEGIVVQEYEVPVTVAHYALELPEAEEFGWVLQARVTLTDTGEGFVDAHVGAPLDYAAFAAHPCRCDHCNTDRNRALTFVVRHRLDGRTLQVGRKCFEDYVGHNGLLALEFVAYVCNRFADEWDDERPARESIHVIGVKSVLAIAESLFLAEGWKNNVKDDYGMDVVRDGTHRTAAKLLLHRKLDRTVPITRATPEGVAAAEAAIAELRELDLNGEDDDFGRNLQYCVGFEVVPAGKAGLVAYAGQYLRSRKARLEREAKRTTMQHVGTVGKREVFAGLTLRRVIDIDTFYGPSAINIFEDADGNELVWKSGACAVNEGDTVTLKATVKEHRERNGAKQTIITRCAVQD